MGGVPEAQIEFSRNEDAARQHDDLVQLVDDRRLADARIARDQNEFRAAMHHDAVEGGKQGGDLALASVELLRDHQPLRRVLQTKRERLDPADRLPGGEALAEIRLDSRGGLVALLGGLREKLHDDHRKGSRHRPCKLDQRDGLSRDVTVDQLDRVNCGERQHAGQQFVKGDPQRVQVASGVDRAVHPASLLRRHVGEGAGDHLGRLRGLTLAQQARGDAKPRELHRSSRAVHQDIDRLDVLVHQAPLVELAQSHGNVDGQAQEALHLHGCAEQPAEWLAAGILEHQHGPTAFGDELQRSYRPCPIKFVLQSIFVREAIEGGRCRMFPGRKHGQHGGAITVVGVASASAEDAFAVLPQDLEVAVPICTEQTRWIQRLASAIAPASLGEGPATFHRPAGRTSLSRKSATYNAA